MYRVHSESESRRYSRDFRRTPNHYNGRFGGDKIVLMAEKEINDLRMKSRENEMKSSSLKKRKRLFEDIANSNSLLKKRKREESDESNSSDRVKKKRKMNEKLKARGKRFFSLLSVTLVQHKNQLEKKKKKSDKCKKSDDVLSKKSAAQKELKSLEKEQKKLEEEKSYTDESIVKMRKFLREYKAQKRVFKKNSKFLSTNVDNKPVIMYRPKILTLEQKKIIKEQEEFDAREFSKAKNELNDFLLEHKERKYKNIDY